MLIIGIVGQPSSGKDTAAEFFASKGFKVISTSEYIRDEMRSVGVPLGRPRESAYVDEQRARFGAEYPVSKIVNLIKTDTVLSGMRTTAEVKLLQKKFGRRFFLIAVDAPLPVRYERSKARNRPGDNISFEAFKAKEESEGHAHGSATQETQDVIALADRVVLNDGSKEQLSARLQDLLAELRQRVDRK